MSTLTVTSKGQVTLRKDVLDHLGVQPGQRISVDKLPDGRVVVSAEHASEPISAVFNLLKKKTVPRCQSKTLMTWPRKAGLASNEDHGRYERSCAGDDR